MSIYIGMEETARKVAGMYLGVDGLARKVVKGYIGAGGLARLFYSAANPLTYTYTGAYTESEITIDGVVYTVLTITSSGTLTVNRAIDADVWLCGGGGDGAPGYAPDFGDPYSGGGGGGGHIAKTSSFTLSKSIQCVIGAATGASNFGELVAAGGTSATDENGGSGASGGGAGLIDRGLYIYYGIGGAGDGTTTIPSEFGSSSPHSAGGGSGVFSHAKFYYGGYGGSNGADGGGDGQRCTGDGSNTRPNTYPAATGGGPGGGGRNNLFRVPNATFYGSGGGGNENDARKTYGGSGYQGVMYIRWRKEDAA